MKVCYPKEGMATPRGDFDDEVGREGEVGAG